MNRAADASRPSGFDPLRDAVSLAGGSRVRGRRQCRRRYHCPERGCLLNRSRDCSRLGARGHLMPASLSLPLRRLPFLLPPLKLRGRSTTLTSRTPRVLTVRSIFGSKGRGCQAKVVAERQARLGAFASAQPAGAIVHEGRRQMPHHREVDIAQPLAARTGYQARGGLHLRRMRVPCPRHCRGE